MVHSEEKELTIRDLLIQLVKWIKYLFSNWLFITIFIIVGLAIGFVLPKLFTKKYVSDISFVIEDNGGSMGANAGLGAAIGLGSTTPGGLFSSVNNIIWLYSSNKMLEKTLLSTGQFPDKSNKLLIQEFIRTSEEVKNYLKDNPDLKAVKFQENQEEFTKEQAIVLKKCIAEIKNNYLEVKPEEKTDNIVKVTFKGEDEDFVYTFSQKLVSLVNDFYINTKTQSAQENVNKLTLKADSLKINLDKSMTTTAVAVDNTPYPNPSRTVLKVEPQKNNVDIQANTTLYLQVVQSLENAKNELARQKPIIKIVDSPILPLRKDVKNLILFMSIGAVLSMFLAITILIIRKIFKDPAF